VYFHCFQVPSSSSILVASAARRLYKTQLLFFLPLSGTFPVRVVSATSVVNSFTVRSRFLYLLLLSLFSSCALLFLLFLVQTTLVHSPLACLLPALPVCYCFVCFIALPFGHTTLYPVSHCFPVLSREISSSGRRSSWSPVRCLFPLMCLE